MNYSYFDFIKQSILFKIVDQLYIWSTILGFEVSENENFCNPFRKDKNPKCYLYYQHPEYVVIDSGGRYAEDYPNRGRITLTIIQALKIKYNLNYNQALNKVLEIHIEGDKKNRLWKVPQRDPSQHVEEDFSFVLGHIKIPYSKSLLYYFNLRGITKENLIEDGIENTNQYVCNSKKTPHHLYTFYPTLAYVIKFPSGNKKIVLPKSSVRFVTNGNPEDIGGIFSRKGKQLIITKSYKDYRVLKNLGYNVCFIMSETILPLLLIEICKDIEDVVIFLDNDKAGKAGAIELQKMLEGSRIVFIPEKYKVKDPDELKIEYGEIDKIIENIIIKNI